jgi:hypothetical protein
MTRLEITLFVFLMEDIIPLCVTNCVDVEVRKLAISAFARGNAVEKSRAIADCIICNKYHEENSKFQLNRTKYKEWFEYIKTIDLN